MAKIQKMTVYVVDDTDEIEDNNDRYDYVGIVENALYEFGVVRVVDEGTAEIGEWHDGHVLNFTATTAEQFEEYFSNPLEKTLAGFELRPWQPNLVLDLAIHGMRILRRDDNYVYHIFTDQKWFMKQAIAKD